MTLNVLHAVSESFKMSTLKWAARIALQDFSRTSWGKVIADFVHRGGRPLLCHLLGVSFAVLDSTQMETLSSRSVLPVQKERIKTCQRKIIAMIALKDTMQLKLKVHPACCALQENIRCLKLVSTAAPVQRARPMTCWDRRVRTAVFNVLLDDLRRKRGNLYVPTVLKAIRNLKKAKVNA
jgi:hypothetical protein